MLFVSAEIACPENRTENENKALVLRTFMRTNRLDIMETDFEMTQIHLLLSDETEFH